MALPRHLESFITKKQVADLYGISERTVQRHISDLLRTQDQEALSNLALVTDEDAKEGSGVTFELIEELNRTGQKPRWYLKPSYAESIFALKSHAALHGSADAAPLSTPPQGSGMRPATAMSPDVPYLMQRIDTLEQQIRDDRDRHDKLVARLFTQLDVKDKQISAWDEVTQGLTKALATGQLAPNLGLLTGDRSRSQATATKPAAETIVDIAPSPVGDETRDSQPKQSPRKPVPKKMTHQKQEVKPKSKKPAPMKAPPKTQPKQQRKPWWNTPIHELFRR